MQNLHIEGLFSHFARCNKILPMYSGVKRKKKKKSNFTPPPPSHIFYLQTDREKIENSQSVENCRFSKCTFKRINLGGRHHAEIESQSLKFSI